MVLFATTGLLLSLVSHILFPVFLTGSKQWIHVSVTIYAFFFQFLKHSSNFLAICTRNQFWSSVNIYGIYLAKISRTLKIRFKIKCTCESDMPKALAISQIVYLPWLSITCISLTFETCAEPVTVHGVIWYIQLCTFV